MYSISDLQLQTLKKGPRCQRLEEQAVQDYNYNVHQWKSTFGMHRLTHWIVSGTLLELLSKTPLPVSGMIQKISKYQGCEHQHKLTNNAPSCAIMHKVYPTLQSHRSLAPLFLFPQVYHSVSKRLRGSLIITYPLLPA